MMQTLERECPSLMLSSATQITSHFKFELKKVYVFEREKKTKVHFVWYIILSDHQINLYSSVSLKVIMAYNVPAVYYIINENFLSGTQYCSFNFK
jgi:hypothetical protein